jgi:PAS domain S-box-containing protein
VKHLTARLDRVLELGRASAANDSLHLARVEAFEQSPTCSLLVTEEELRIVAANEAMRLACGCSEKQLTSLSITHIFQREGDTESLLQQLRSPSPEFPIRARQRTRNGATREVEIIGYRVRARGRTLLAFNSQDISLRNKPATPAQVNQVQQPNSANNNG